MARWTVVLLSEEINTAEKMNPKLVEGQLYKVNPMGFSRSDLSGNFSFGTNGWVTPSGTDKILYFDSNMQYPFHLEYKSE